jgi:F-type H+-transporting ATPase subunit b
MLLLIPCFGRLPVYAQKPAEPAKPDVQRPRGPGQELAHETREAAGEETDETTQFKQSSSVAFIAKLTGLSLGNAYFFSVLLNFAAVAALIVWAGKKSLPGIFRARTAAIQKAMQEAQKASEEARQRLAEIENRLRRLDGEIGMMRNAAEKEADAEDARIQSAAEEDARKIVEGAQQEIAAAAKAARRQLTAYAADLAVGLAQKQIRIDAATDEVLLRNFARELGGSPGSLDATGKDGH